MSDTGILAYGAYIPRSRLQRSAIFDAHEWFAPGLKSLAKGERASANWDEDPITMAVEAARDALTGIDRAVVGAVSLASTTLPFADRLNAGVVKEALNLPDAVESFDVAGSQRAGASALIQALKSTTATSKPHLCTAAELRMARPASEEELRYGDAAAALLVGKGKAIARFLGSYSTTVDFVDHFRSSGEDFDYAWESRWIRDEGFARIAGDGLKSALRVLKVDAADIARAVIAIPLKGVAESLAKKAGMRPECVSDTLLSNVGDSGAAHPILMLADALERAKPGEKILLVAFGQGIDVALFETTDDIAGPRAQLGVKGTLARRQADTNYHRFLFHRGLLNLERGMRAEHDQKQPGSALYRNRKAVLGLIGGRCTKTGVVQFPKTQISVNQNDRADGTQEDYPLAEKMARVVTYTADALAYSPDPPLYHGMIDFEGGGRMPVEFADVAADDVQVGAEMRMVFRIKALDEIRHFKRYFWKATRAN